MTFGVLLNYWERHKIADLGNAKMTRLEVVRQRSERAKEQFRELDGEVRAFRDSEPYKIIPEYDSESGTILYRLGSIEPVPIRVSHIAGEVIHALRSTLDHLVYQLLLAANPSATDEQKRLIQFPIYDPAKQTQAAAFRHIQPLGPSAIKAISAIKPYKGGNDVLWHLNRLDNINKHRTILTVGIAHGMLDFTDTLHAVMEKAWGESLPKFSFSVPTVLTGKAVDVGDVLYVGFPIDEEVNKKLKFPFDIALAEPEVPASEPLLETIQGMFDIVNNLLADFAPLL